MGDKYLSQLNDNADLLTDYVGLEWRAPSPIDKTFYSLIIHSPASQKIFELMSFDKPDLARYPNLRKSFAFTPTNEVRASFLAYDTAKGEFPWTVHPFADILPIKISFGCADLSENIDFYTEVLEATILHEERDL